MGTILRWPKHFQSRCNCQDGIERACCVLFTCARCNASEGELPTECPGVKMDSEYRAEVYAGTLDFTLEKGWHTPKEYLHGK